jgi:hypothetical protein
MNARNATIIAAALAVGPFTFEQRALAQSNCRQVKAEKVSVFNGVTTTGTVIKGGTLNGMTLEVFTSGGVPTPDPTTVTFTGNLTLTTNHGQLKASNVYMLDVATGVGAVLWRIDPSSSTGRFAGATGVLNTAVKVTSFNPDTFHEEITGEICFAQ